MGDSAHGCVKMIDGRFLSCPTSNYSVIDGETVGIDIVDNVHAAAERNSCITPRHTALPSGHSDVVLDQSECLPSESDDVDQH